MVEFSIMGISLVQVLSETIAVNFEFKPKFPRQQLPAKFERHVIPNFSVVHH